MSSSFPLELNGNPPELAGGECEAFICESYVYDGKMQDTANVTYLRFNGHWHRLYFDCGIIFWRTQEDAPKPWSAPEHGWDYPHTDVGNQAGVIGCKLIGYDMYPTDSGSKVVFTFDNGSCIRLEDSADCSNYYIVRAL